VCVCVLFQMLSVSSLYGLIGITTDHRLDGLGSIPERESNFSLLLSVQIGPGIKLTSYSAGTEESFPEAKLQRREASRSPASSAEIKYAGAIIPLPTHA
jgi:hypothetical protein